MSDYDNDTNVAGYEFVTHKATEGTSVLHTKMGPRLTAFHAAGVPVLGTYHVLRTPGSGGVGSLTAQRDYWYAAMDKAIPWWRRHPNFILQIDAETWSYDTVSAATVLAFAHLLADDPENCYKILYASHGQYGNSLTGCGLPLWNANYPGGVTYPGDNYPGWTPYSGQTPRIAQWTSTPYDINAYRGTVDQLLTETRRTDMAITDDDANRIAAAVLAARIPDTDTAAHAGPRSVQDITHDGAKIRAVLIGELTPAEAGFGPDTPLAKLLSGQVTVEVTQDQLNAAIAANIDTLVAVLTAYAADHIRVV
jgi:hypothetical protein